MLILEIQSPMRTLSNHPQGFSSRFISLEPSPLNSVNCYQRYAFKWMTLNNLGREIVPQRCLCKSGLILKSYRLDIGDCDQSDKPSWTTVLAELIKRSTLAHEIGMSYYMNDTNYSRSSSVIIRIMVRVKTSPEFFRHSSPYADRLPCFQLKVASTYVLQAPLNLDI
jgi:hypothetical protein